MPIIHTWVMNPKNPRTNIKDVKTRAPKSATFCDQKTGLKEFWNF